MTYAKLQNSYKQVKEHNILYKKTERTRCVKHKLIVIIFYCHDYYFFNQVGWSFNQTTLNFFATGLMTPTNAVSNSSYDANCGHSILNLHVLLKKLFLLEATTLIFLFGR